MDEIKFFIRAPIPGGSFPSSPTDEEWFLTNKYVVDNQGTLLFSGRGVVKVKVMTFGQTFRAGRTCSIGLKVYNGTNNTISNIKFRLVRRISIAIKVGQTFE